MTNELTYPADSLFDNVMFDRDGELDILFYQLRGIYTSSSGFWRLLENNKILFVSATMTGNLDCQNQNWFSIRRT